MAVKLKERRPGEWWLFIDHRGKRTAKKIGRVEKKAAEATRKKVEQRLAAEDLGLVPKVETEPTTPTLTVYTARYLKTIEPRVEYTTHVDYETSFRLRILPELGARPIGEITRAEVKQLALKLRAEGASPRNVRKTIATLSSLYSEAIDDQLVPANPASGHRKLFRSEEFKNAVDKKSIDPLTRDELAHLLHTAATHEIERRKKPHHPFRPHLPFLLLLARTGLRLGEALALRWGDIDFAGGFLTVQRAWVKGRITDPKNHKTRRVDLSTQLRATLAEVWADRFERVVAIDAEAQAALEAARAGALDAWVFSEASDPSDPDNFRKRVFDPLLVAAKLRHIRIHDLRHTYASLLLQAGTELLYVSHQLGHHSAAFTLKVYGHLIPADRRGDVDRLDDATARNPSATGAPEPPPEREKALQPVRIAGLSARPT